MLIIQQFLSLFVPALTLLQLPSRLWSSPSAAYPDLYEASVAELQAGLNTGHFTSVDLVKAYFARIEEVNLKGPALRAVIEINPSALDTARELDVERREKGPRSALHGIPILLKDNIATITSEGMNTTAGSFSLLYSVVPDDAGVVKRLRKAGAIILGKANMSEFAHYRGDTASGWSGRGGQGTNAYYPKADPCGSSSGSGIAASIGLAAVTLGTETDGSITCPSSHNNIVGIKPTLGLTSRVGVIPISTHQDTIGPMTRSVADAAIVLSVIAGPDPNDNYTFAQPPILPNFAKALNKRALRGKRLGVPRHVFMDDPTGRRSDVIAAFNEALHVLRKLGATIVDPADLPSADEMLASRNKTVVLTVDFKIGINNYFDGLVSNPSGVRSLIDLIKFNDNNPGLEKPEGYEDQSILINSEVTPGFDSSFFAALSANHDLGASRGIDAALKAFKLDALILPADHFTSTPAALVGYPIVTGECKFNAQKCSFIYNFRYLLIVPLGFFSDKVSVGRAGPQTVYPAPGVPFGLSFFGTAFSDYKLIGYAYAYEQATLTRLKRRAFAAAIPKTQLKDIPGTA